MWEKSFRHKIWENPASDGISKGKEKKEIYRQIQEGEAKLIIGTHALIQEKVLYQDLALVITDEQHRFGVNQREDLSRKGDPMCWL